MKNYKQESMISIAFDYLESKHQPTAFKELWKDVVEKLELSDEQANQKISLFYTELTLDGRFVTLGENTWDLRAHHTYDKVHIDMNDIYAEVEDISALADDLIDFVSVEDLIIEEEDDEEAENEEDEY